MTNNSWMVALADQLGIDAISLDAEGRAGVRHPDGVDVEIHTDSDRRLVHLCALVAPIPVLGSATRLNELLRHSAARHGAYEPAFAVERESRCIALSLSLPEDGLDAVALANALRMMVERCIAARAEFSRGEA